MKSSDLRTETKITERLFPARKDYWCVGIDSGYSAVKLIAPNKYARIPFLGCRIPKDRMPHLAGHTKPEEFTNSAALMQRL